MANQSADALVREAPAEHTFKLHKTSIEIRSIPELAEALEIMSEESFVHHVNEKKNDFAAWVRDVMHDDELSAKLEGTKDRVQAFQVVKQRAKEAVGRSNAFTYTSTVFGFNLWDVIIGFIAGLIIGLFLGHFLIPSV
jgi:hypothetical protein